MATVASQAPPQVTGDDGLGPVRLPVDRETYQFDDWTIGYTKSHILKSMCVNGDRCVAGEPDCCELCVYNFALALPHLPDMVFHRNVLRISHSSGAQLEFNPLDALKLVCNEKLDLKVACSEEWRESRPEAAQTSDKVKHFDWTFTTEYAGTVNDRFRVETTDQRIDMFKLMRKENILFYHNLTLFEDELHDHGIALLSVKVRVMPSGFYVLLRFFLRVDNVLLRSNDTRFHYEKGNDYVLKEFTHREAKVEQLKHIPPALFTNPDHIVDKLPVIRKVNEKLTVVTGAIDTDTN